ncbi:hypothetical protein [Photobacterium phosphoreum]|uniref:hypothetical protein n=1 Tax=Photobacterium phosphoreum TaxID=659 RepID=UPI0007F8E107|nr:hypothetical protein [Photobacterium phosphoreum]OBU37622.1 hypothetical protein AYY24_10965 [Photobacterium phosphoreum]OBU47317.1 hypothetical protein AYY26_11795 [Photobacterium phosphoreum]PSW36081.1 hypothetical protein CTM87_13585 [Photobacterium phosphoreum]
MHPKKLNAINVSFNEYEAGIERYVRCTWSIHIYRHHVYRTNLSDLYVSNINQINESLGIPVKTIDLNEYKEHFRTSEVLNKLIEESEYPTWIWFYGIEALKDSNFAGWLRARLTVRSIENLRVIFVAESIDDYHAVFCDNRAPFYQSTMLLNTDYDVKCED